MFIVLSFYLQVQREGSWADDEFRPTPIPLNEWRPHYERRESRAGTLHEAIQTDAARSAAVPAHYWEDALRHSVYLTLVRDKIDQLIAKGDVITPDSKEHHASKEVDDHDLWEKIKTAPFDRKPDKEPVSTGDVTIMAKGRLMEEHGAFRFSEDEMSKEKCGDEKCAEGVKAFWSVKRVRQREIETSPGRYHYELTFSVVSQTPKKPKKPYENPARTFTVRESVPEKVVDMPQEHRTYERIPPQTARPERAIWFHKNIVPFQNHHHHQARQYQHGLDRLFSSLFSDEEETYEPPRYRPSPHIQPHQQYSQFAKAGYVGSPSDQQKRLTPYPYKPHSYKYTRPLPPPPQYQHMQHHYIDSDNIGVVNGAYQQEHRYVPSMKPGKPTRPSVSPTVSAMVEPPKNWTVEGDKKSPNATNNITKAAEPVVHKIERPNYSKPRPAPMKINYLPDHVRPPIYNAPPGVFVTMDKKPFKPMPPLKLISKPQKSHRPVDFRPSPQVLDMQQFSEPDPLFDSAFKPITWNYSDTNTTEKIEVAESSTQVSNNTHNTRKSNPKGKKPPKKHENIKAQRITTSAPEIITASSDSAEEEIDALQWANVVGAFTKTTPMEPQKDDKSEENQSTTSLPTTTTTVSSTTPRRRITTTTEAIEETTTTTHRPPKRTRPPPKFTKPEKVKKHKRITTTKAPAKKTTEDLSPQASSAAATKPFSNSVNRTLSTTSSTTTTTTTTTPRPKTTTKKATTTQSATTTQPATTVSETQQSFTTQPKIKNRFRQSTLMQKGTSVNHDKWSVNSADKTRTVSLSGKYPPRRKGSNFQGYVSSTTPRMSDIDEDDHEDHAIFSTARISSTTETTTVRTTKPTTPAYEDTADQYEGSESTDYTNNHEDEFDVDIEHTFDGDDDEEDSQDHKEFIFHVTSTTPSEKTNEIEQDPITTEQIITSPHSTPKNKTKCKKKKNQNGTSTEVTDDFDLTTTTTTTEGPTPSILEELFGGFTLDATTEKETKSTPKPELEEQESENHQQFVKIDDDLQDFLDSLKEGEKHVDGDDQYDEEDDESEPQIDEEDSLEDDGEDTASPRDSDTHYEEYPDRPYSLLELMAME